MPQLQDFADYMIDWNLTPEHAVTMYLEWGNNDWNAEYPPVRTESDSSTYFVVDTWEPGKPMIRLVHRTTEQADDLLSMPLPQELMPGFAHEYGSLKGVFAPSPEIKDWLKHQLGQA